MKNKQILFIILSILLNNISIVFGQTQDFPISTNIENRVINGEYTVYYGNNNSNQTIQKPFIICEGFDALNNMEVDDIKGQLNFYENTGFVNDFLVHDKNLTC